MSSSSGSNSQRRAEVLMLGLPRDSAADEAVVFVDSYVNLEGPSCAGRNFLNTVPSSALKVKKIHTITQHNIPQDRNLH
jgi:hypothetical protein